MSYSVANSAIHPINRDCVTSSAPRKRGAIALYTDALNLIERDLIAAPVIEAGSPGRLMGSHLLGDFEPSAAFEIGGDAGSAEGERWLGLFEQIPVILRCRVCLG